MLSQLTDGVLKQTRTFQRADFMNEYEFEAYGNSSLHHEFSFLKDKNRGAIKHRQQTAELNGVVLRQLQSKQFFVNKNNYTIFKGYFFVSYIPLYQNTQILVLHVYFVFS